MSLQRDQHPVANTHRHLCGERSGPRKAAVKRPTPVVEVDGGQRDHSLPGPFLSSQAGAGGGMGALDPSFHLPGAHSPLLGHLSMASSAGVPAVGSGGAFFGGAHVQLAQHSQQQMQLQQLIQHGVLLQQQQQQQAPYAAVVGAHNCQLAQAVAAARVGSLRQPAGSGSNSDGSGSDSGSTEDSVQREACKAREKKERAAVARAAREHKADAAAGRWVSQQECVGRVHGWCVACHPHSGCLGLILLSACRSAERPVKRGRGRPRKADTANAKSKDNGAHPQDEEDALLDSAQGRGGAEAAQGSARAAAPADAGGAAAPATTGVSGPSPAAAGRCSSSTAERSAAAAGRSSSTALPTATTLKGMFKHIKRTGVDRSKGGKVADALLQAAEESSRSRESVASLTATALKDGSSDTVAALAKVSRDGVAQPFCRCLTSRSPFLPHS